MKDFQGFRKNGATKVDNEKPSVSERYAGCKYLFLKVDPSLLSDG